MWIAITIFSFSAISQPVNDDYVNAIDVSSLINSCSADGAYTTASATSDNNAGSCWNSTGGSNVWFKFVATTTQINIQVKTGGAEGTVQNLHLALWQSDGTTQIACMNYVTAYSDLELGAVNLTIGNTYYISVDNYYNPSWLWMQGTFKLCLQNAVTYDFYEGAQDVTSLINSCSADEAYTTEQATNDKNPGSCFNSIGGSNRWFKFVATTTQINIQVKTGGTEGTLQNAYVTLWQSDGTTQMGCMAYVTAYSDVEIGSVSLTVGNTYYISVDNYYDPAYLWMRGTFKLCLQDAATYDFYEDAINVTPLINSCSNDAEYTTEQATNDKSPGSCYNSSGGSNRWFKFVATSTQIKIQAKTGGTEGTAQNLYMTLWQSNGTTEIACTTYTTQYSDIEINASSLIVGNTYYISVDNYYGPSYLWMRGTFTLCLYDMLTILPVQLLYFKATKEDAIVSLNWATASELNNDYFEIEKSNNGIDFSYLTKVNVNNNSVQVYETKDSSPNDGISYYRLKQVDKDGTYKYIATASIEFNNKLALSFFPNPASEIIEVKVSQSNIGSTLKIVNATGYQMLPDIILSQNNTTINVSNLTTGIYYIITTSANSVERSRISVVK